MNSLHPGIKFKDLQQLGRDIELNLPPIYSEVLIKKLATISTENEHNKSVAIGDFIEKCCHYEPKNSQEFVAYVKIAASIELLKVHSMHIRAQKSRLTDHTYAHNLDFWTQDTEKVGATPINSVYFILTTNTIFIRLKLWQRPSGW